MKYMITYTGFHGRVWLAFRPQAIVGDRGRVSVRVAQRLNAAVCPVADCRCGEAVARDCLGEGSYWVSLAPKQRGHYPQE